MLLINQWASALKLLKVASFDFSFCFTFVIKLTPFFIYLYIALPYYTETCWESLIADCVRQGYILN